MDKEISVQERKQGRSKLWGYAVVGLVLLISAVWWMRQALSNSLERSEIRVAQVEVGDVSNTLSATGEVQPVFEQVMISPVAAVLQEVFFNIGNTVKVGDRILALDKTSTTTAYEKQKDELDLKRNSITKLRLELDKSFYDIKIQDSIKACRITSLKAELETARRLFNAGGGAREAIEQAETNLRIAQLEKRQLENDIRSRQAVMQTSLRESEITASIQEKELGEFSRRLAQADMVATRAGVLTFVNTNLGARVNEGDVLARVADLKSFKVMGSISDTYAQQLRVGMPVLVRINEQITHGTLNNIQPSVSNNVVNFEVALDEAQANNLLRPRMKVELYLVTDAHQKVLRVANGAAFKGGTTQDVFVLRPDGKAERRTVQVGLSNFEYIEIVAGLQAGETIILSDLSEYRNATELTIK